jgi:lysophospholipase L1-like esterase
MKKFFSLFVTLSLVSSIAHGAIKVHTIGDSTMENYNPSATDKRGWATYLSAFFDDSQVTVNNRGKSGKDTRTYYNDNAYWASVKSQMSEGDYLIIQFAHNDEGTVTYGMDNLEYAAYCQEHGIAVPSDNRGTNPQTTYRDYLRLFIDEARALGVNPVLVGPICRAYFQGNTIKRSGQHDLGDKFSKIEEGVLYENQTLPAGDSTMSYVKAMKVVAMEKNVPFVDLTKATMDLYLSYGEAQCLNMMFVNKDATTKDATHTNALGANLIAREAAMLLKEAGILDEYITIPTDISANPNNFEIGETYSGVMQNREFLLTGYGLEPEEGSITLSATANLQISLDQNSYASTATATYSSGSLLQKVYIRANYTAAGQQLDTVYAVSGEHTIAIPVSAQVISLDGGSAVSAYWTISDKTKPGEAVVEGPISTAFAMSNMIAADTKSDAGPTGNLTVVRFHNANANNEKVNWPANEIDEVATRYIDFAVSAPSMMEVRLTGISMEIGAYSTGTMKCHISTGMGDDFKEEQIIYEASEVALPNIAPTVDKTTKEITAYGAAMRELDLKPMITIPAGETLHVRILPWHESTKEGSGKYVCIRNLKVEGQAFEPETQGLENTHTEILNQGKGVKVLRNGQLFIIKNGILYNAQGAVVR